MPATYFSDFDWFTALVSTCGERCSVVYSAYDADFVRSIKATGAKFASINGRKGWYLPIASKQTEAFREICGDYRRAAAKASAAKAVSPSAPWAGSSVSDQEYAGLRESIGESAAREMARQMRG